MSLLGNYMQIHNHQPITISDKYAFMTWVWRCRITFFVYNIFLLVPYICARNFNTFDMKKKPGV
jgi:hypothetical protein